MILANNLLPEEQRRVWGKQARAHADEIHQSNLAYTAEVVLIWDPQWKYNTPGAF